MMNPRLSRPIPNTRVVDIGLDLNQPYVGLVTSLMHKMYPEDLLVMTPLGEQTR